MEIPQHNLTNKRVFISLIDGKEYFGKICLTTVSTVYIEIKTELSDKKKISIPWEEVKNVESKQHVHFINPVGVLNKETDHAMTKHIEKIKEEPEFTLSTRRYKEQINGKNKREEWKSYEFEKVVAKWLSPTEQIDIFPFALVKIKEDEFLLGIQRNRRVVKLSKTGKNL